MQPRSPHPYPGDTKRVFWKKGACSHTIFFLINRALGHPDSDGERGANPLAGGILNHGYQCGLLWGAVLGAGAHAFHRHGAGALAMGTAVHSSIALVDDFVKIATTTECRGITRCTLTKPSGMVKALLSGVFITCFKLAEQWAPRAIESAESEVSLKTNLPPNAVRSCASEVVKLMGGRDLEQITVAGFAGGVGLSGSGCGALGAALWLEHRRWSELHPGKNSLSTPAIKARLKRFKKSYGDNLSCEQICGRKFHTIEEHSDFVAKGGCRELIQQLAATTGANN
jgi:hypothetical protein